MGGEQQLSRGFSCQSGAGQGWFYQGVSVLFCPVEENRERCASDFIKICVGDFRVYWWCCAACQRARVSHAEEGFHFSLQKKVFALVCMFITTAHLGNFSLFPLQQILLSNLNN